MPEYKGIVYTIGCSHNQCIFCPAYKQTNFRIRNLVEMEQDMR
jgi:histone acetyltransferase (RNA polymerase elongator complex component)